MKLLVLDLHTMKISEFVNLKVRKTLKSWFFENSVYLKGREVYFFLQLVGNILSGGRIFIRVNHDC